VGVAAVELVEEVDVDETELDELDDEVDVEGAVPADVNVNF
jgi:hypothetical protein